ncbi:DUF3352 domain-containing protein [Aeromicrobium alkaliterrae]|uniref:DUF3352 domain-containing protein n=1 Tax=Aeromicrobium alkaliterrae TaxID=302168 RepID=A0ABP4W4G7_9ACTN
MSTLPPPPGTSPEPSSSIGTVPPPPGAGTAAPAGGSGRGGVPRGLKIGFGALGLLLIAGAAFGGWYAYDKLSGGGPQPADVLPSSTVAYARLDLDPSASQKIALLDLIDRVPEVKEGLGLEDVDSQADLREVAFTQWFGLDEACGVDYDTDVKPWIGERAGLALVGGFEVTADEDETALSIARNAVLVVQVTDEGKAREGLTKLAADCGILEELSNELGEDVEEPGIVFRDGYALVTIDQDSADKIDAAADEGTLAGGNDKFAADMDTLGEDGVASVWYDQGALVLKAEEAIDELGDDAPADLEEFLDSYSVLDTTAFTIRASDDSLEAAGVSTLTRDIDVPDAESLAGLPEDTMIGLSLVGGGRLADNLYETILPLGDLFFGFNAIDNCFPTDEDPEQDFSSEDCGSGPTFEDALEDFEDATDLTLPEDLETLLGDELNVYLGSTGIEDLQDADDLEEAIEIAQAGIEISSQGDVVDVLEKLIDFAGIDLEVTPTDDGAIVATNPDAADTLESDDGLSGTEAFQSVINEHDRPLGGAYVEISALLDGLKSLGMPADQVDDLAFLKAFGLTAWLEDDDVVAYSAKLSFTPQD